MPTPAHIRRYIVRGYFSRHESVFLEQYLQERRDTVCVPEPVVAFDLPWLAKYYGFDWGAGSVASGQASGDSLVTPAGDSKAGAERLSAGKAGDADSYTL